MLALVTTQLLAPTSRNGAAAYLRSGMEPIGGAWIQLTSYITCSPWLVIFDVEPVFLLSPAAVSFNQLGPAGLMRSLDLHLILVVALALCLAPRRLEWS